MEQFWSLKPHCKSTNVPKGMVGLIWIAISFRSVNNPFRRTVKKWISLIKHSTLNLDKATNGKTVDQKARMTYDTTKMEKISSHAICGVRNDEKLAILTSGTTTKDQKCFRDVCIRRNGHKFKKMQLLRYVSPRDRK